MAGVVFVCGRIKPDEIMEGTWGHLRPEDGVKRGSVTIIEIDGSPWWHETITEFAADTAFGWPPGTVRTVPIVVTVRGESITCEAASTV